MTQLEKAKGAGLCQFLDIKTCFDVIELRDILAETVKAGVTGKPLRNIARFTDKNKIFIQGDETGNHKIVTNSAGQGSGYAPTGTSLTMAKVINDNIAKREEELGQKISAPLNGIPMSHLMFVDDFSKCCMTSEESKQMGIAITKALKSLKMEAHKDKSCILVFGKKRDSLKEEILSNPTIIQDFTMAFKDSETYLGMQFSQLGAVDSITMTLLARRVKCMVKAIDLRNKLEDLRVQSLGWLVTALTVFKAVIVSTLTYGCGAWVNLTKAQEELIEAIQRQCLVTVLGISSRCSYQTLLHVTSIPPAMEIVNKTKVTFVNDLLHIKGKGICAEVIQLEHEATPNKGIIREVKDICQRWGLEDVSQTYVEPKRLKSLIESQIKQKVLVASLMTKSAPLHRLKDKSNRQRDYFLMPKERAMLGLAYDVGCLNLRGNRRAESLKKFGTTKCLVPACTGEDNWGHITQGCQGYMTPAYKDKGEVVEFIDYLYNINRERVSRFKTSMVNWSS